MHLARIVGFALQSLTEQLAEFGVFTSVLYSAYVCKRYATARNTHRVFPSPESENAGQGDTYFCGITFRVTTYIRDGQLHFSRRGGLLLTSTCKTEAAEGEEEGELQLLAGHAF